MATTFLSRLLLLYCGSSVATYSTRQHLSLTGEELHEEQIMVIEQIDIYVCKLIYSTALSCTF